MFYELWDQLYYDLGRKLDVISTTSDIASQAKSSFCFGTLCRPIIF